MSAKKDKPLYLILKGFCYENSKGEAVYVSRKTNTNTGHPADQNITELPKEAVTLGKKLKAIKAV